MALAFDAASEATPGDATSFTWSHTCTGANLLLYIGLPIRTVTAASGVTYNGVAATLVHARNHAGSLIRAEVWRLIAPATGAHNVVVTFPSTTKCAPGAVSFTDGHQTTPEGTAADAQNTSSDTSVSVAISSASNEIGFSVCAWKNEGTISPGGGATERWDGESGVGNTHVVGGGATATGAASLTMSWDMDDNANAVIVAVPIKPTSGSTSVSSTTVAGGELTIVTPGGQTGYGGIDTDVLYDLESSYFAVELVNAGAQSADRQSFIAAVLDGSNEVALRVFNSNLEARQTVAGTPSTLDTAVYNATNHRFIRLREASGTTFWEYRSAVGSWTELHSVASPVDVSDVTLRLRAGNINSTTATTVVFDNINVVVAQPATLEGDLLMGVG